MSKTVMIPSHMIPCYVCFVNGKRYAYPAGTVQEVPDEVAAIIENFWEMKPEPEPAESDDHNCVSYEEQELTDEQKAQARANIGAAEVVKPREKAEITVTTQDNALLNKNNQVEAFNGVWCRYTNLIPVCEGDRFSFVASSAAGDDYPNILWLDASENVISTEHHTSLGVGCLLVTVPAGVAYVRFADSGYGTFESQNYNIRVLRFEVLHMPRADEAATRETVIQDVVGGYYGNGNTFAEVSGMSTKRTDPIPVYTGDTFFFTGGDGKSKAIWYNQDGSELAIVQGNGTQMELLPPDGAVLVRFVSYEYSENLAMVLLSVGWSTEEKTLEYLQAMNHMWGKKYVACGDSFTAGDFTAKTDETWDEATQEYKTYCWHIANRNRMKLVNEARSGSTMYNNGDANAFSVTRYTQVPKDADYITLCFGLNDQTSGGNIGALTDTTNATVIGAWNVVLEYLITNMPYAKIGIIIADAYINSTMRDAIVSVAKYWGIPYLDLKGDPKVPMLIGGRFSDVTVSSRAVELRNAAFQISTTDSHPNAKGHAYRSTIIENFMRSL